MLVDRLVGPYTGRALTPLATIDLVGWDIHRAIVDNVYENTNDEAHETQQAARLHGQADGEGRARQQDRAAASSRRTARPASCSIRRRGDYKPESEIALPDLGYIDEVVAAATARVATRRACRSSCAPRATRRRIARKVIAGYISYAFHRVGEVTETIDGIDRIMGMGFNWAPPSVLVDTHGRRRRRRDDREGRAPGARRTRARPPRTGKPERFFDHPTINLGRFFVAG